MSESDMRGRVVQALRPLDAISVENPAYPGTPDVNFVEGWVELKWLRAWPAREDSVVKLEHFTQQQRVWLIRRARAGGNVWVLLQCRQEWLLFTGEVAARVLGRTTRQDLIKACTRHWQEGLVDLDLVFYIRRPTE